MQKTLSFEHQTRYRAEADIHREVISSLVWILNS